MRIITDLDGLAEELQDVLSYRFTEESKNEGILTAIRQFTVEVEAKLADKGVMPNSDPLARREKLCVNFKNGACGYSLNGCSITCDRETGLIPESWQ